MSERSVCGLTCGPLRRLCHKLLILNQKTRCVGGDGARWVYFRERPAKSDSLIFSGRLRFPHV